MPDLNQLNLCIMTIHLVSQLPDPQTVILNPYTDPYLYNVLKEAHSMINHGVKSRLCVSALSNVTFCYSLL
ncbi:unnamed protein product [Callosobruchus maculatus]|uniref:Uncharacterized protein n=1 Tax=Callosobruchus maculatus TaxID=64391 RepID=A0A653CVE2_CALMS|nr:unnamed protein product [Callosobruchus maculatus]